MTSIFLHEREPCASIKPSERRAVIDKRGELALPPGLVAPPVFDDRVPGATTGGQRTLFHAAGIYDCRLAYVRRSAYTPIRAVGTPAIYAWTVKMSVPGL